MFFTFFFSFRNSETLNHVLTMYKKSLADPCNNDVILNFDGFKACRSHLKGKYGFSNQINKFVEQVSRNLHTNCFLSLFSFF